MAHIVTESVERSVSRYEKWVGLNPCSSAEIESAIKYLSYIFTSQFETSNLISELIYSLSNLLAFFNDKIVFETIVKSGAQNPYRNKLKKWLTILNHCEVLIELSAQRSWGNRGKWIVIFTIQTFKSIIRLLLLYQQNEHIIECPPIHPLDRRSAAAFLENKKSGKDVVSLKNGRMIRTVDSAPSIVNRDWKLPAPLVVSNNDDKPLNYYQLKAETLYIMKPLIHLCSIYCFGQKSWKSWLLAFSIDIASIRLMARSSPDEPCRRLSKRQRTEMNRRTLALFLYLMRSPFFDRATKERLTAVLAGLSRAPLLGLFFKSINEYIPQWQQTYFYLWSS